MSDSHPTRLAVLHGLRVKGFAEIPALADFAGLEEPLVAEKLDALSSAGLADHRNGAIAGWHLTPAGHAGHAAALAADVADSGAAGQVRSGYERFDSLDGAVRAVCTAWQVRDLDAGMINDHSDPGYDAAVLARLAVIHADAVTVIDGLAVAIARFGPYRRRLDRAHDRVQGGDRDALTKPLSDSYHDVWMELHEDLLVTLGLDRSSLSPDP